MIKEVLNASWRHKKKIIVFVILPLLIYKLRHKLTLSLLLKAYGKIEGLLQWLPLPEVSRFRDCTPFQFENAGAVKELLPIIDLEGIKSKIKNGRSTWNELKASVLTGVCLTASLYNIKSIYDLVEIKYRKDFEQLGASQNFSFFMNDLRQKFIKELSLLHKIAVQELAGDIEKLSVTENYDAADIIQIITRLQAKLFERKYDISKLNRKSIIQEANFKVKHYFLSAKIQPLDQSRVKRFFNSTSNFISNILNWSDRSEKQEQVTIERYSFCQTFYQLSSKKTSLIGEWSPESQKLAKLVLQQISYLFESLNFHTLAKSYAELRLSMLVNRIMMYVEKSGKREQIMAKWIIVLHKIAKEQFLSSEAEEIKQRFYHKELKKAIQINLQPQVNKKNTFMITRILQQMYAQKAFVHGEKQFAIKYYDERSEVPLGEMGDRNQSQGLTQLLAEINKSSLSKEEQETQ